MQAARADAEAALAKGGRAARVGGRAPKQAPERGDTARFLRRTDEAAAGRATLVAVLDALLAVQRSAPWAMQGVGFLLWNSGKGWALLNGAWPGFKGCCMGHAAM